MWTVSFWKQLFEDAVTAASVALAAFLGDLADVWSVDWKQGLGFALGGALLAVLKGLGVRNVGTPNTTSMVKQDEGVA